MEVVGVIVADLNTSPLGTRSRQGDDLRGRTVLTRTVQRVRQAERLEHVFVVCPRDQADGCGPLLGDSSVSLVPSDAGPPRFRPLIRVARKWSLDGWRGGMGGAYCLDEYAHCAEWASVAKQVGADAVWTCPGAAPLVDPALIDAMIAHHEAHADQMLLTFAPAPPGLVGSVFRTNLLEDVSQQQAPPGFILAYKPDAPQMDLAFKECCLPTPEAVRHASGRLIADTRRAFETLDDLLAAHPEPDAETVGRWLIERAEKHVPPLPREVEIELTTDDQLPDTVLRPRGQCVPNRGPIDPSAVAAIAKELAAYDDSLVVLGGFGEPLLHPQFDEIVAALRSAGMYGVAVRTNGLALNDEAIASLVKHRVDVVALLLDAWTDDLYRKLHDGHELSAVTAAIDKLEKARSQAKQVEPAVLPHLTKTTNNVDEMDDFFDGWIRRVGWAVIEGYSHHAGQLPDRAVVDMSPPTRTPCRRIRTRCTILADGRLTLCDQDFTGATTFGSIHETSLTDLWHGEWLTAARAHHDNAQYQDLPLCPTCSEWHRP
jgi:spiro-SPASM protein